MKKEVFKDSETGNFYRIHSGLENFGKHYYPHSAYIWYKEISSNEFRARMNAKLLKINHVEFALKLESKQYEFVQPKKRFSTIYKQLKQSA